MQYHENHRKRTSKNFKFLQRLKRKEKKGESKITSPSSEDRLYKLFSIWQTFRVPISIQGATSGTIGNIQTIPPNKTSTF